MSKLSVFDKNGNASGEIELPDNICDGRINTAVLHQAIVMYQASLRQGNVFAKGRAEVSGGGAKPFRQKGTGRARAGSSRSPLWHGGGVTFGPHPRDFWYTVPKKIKKAALRESLNAKFTDKDLVCICDLKEPFSKTKEFAKFVGSLNLRGKILAILDGSDESVVRVSNNIPFFQLMRAQDVNAYDIMRNKKVVVTETALKQLVERVKK